MPDVIVLGPGGAKGYLELGAILNLQEKEYLKNVKSWVGCSIGAAIALLVVAGFGIPEIIEDCININIFRDMSSINFSDIKEKAGLINIKTVEDKLCDRVKQKFGIVPTLQQLFMATGVMFTTVSYNVDKDRTEYISKYTEPNLSCVEAAMMSMAMPLIIQGRKYKGNIYVDGALGDPYPILHYDNGINKIWGIYIDGMEENVASEKNPLRYIFKLIQGPMRRLTEKNIKMSSDKCIHIKLRTPIIDSLGLSLTDKDKRKMIKSGFDDVEHFLRRLFNPERYKLILDDDEEIPTGEDILASNISEELQAEVSKILYGDKDGPDVISVELTPNMVKSLRDLH